jgi:hypothetical protein
VDIVSRKATSPIAVVLIAPIVATACTSSKSERTPKRYDAVVFLCAGPPLRGPCTHPASDAEVETVRGKLGTDSAVQETVYVSPAQAIQLDRKAQVAGLRPGDLPASFTVRFTDPNAYAGFAASYAKLDGVEYVRRCGAQVLPCREGALRRVGAVK